MDYGEDDVKPLVNWWYDRERLNEPDRRHWNLLGLLTLKAGAIIFFGGPPA